MADPSEPPEASPEPGSDGTADGREDDDREDDDGPADPQAAEPEESAPARDPETLQEAVEERYDFEHFTPADMAEMTVEEWEAAFDPESWITGPELLDRVEADLRSRVARREVFAVVERTRVDGVEHVLAYTDVGYALVGPDGGVRGEGSILEDVEPVVALCSMEDYDPPEPPADAGLPRPDEVGEGSGSMGDRLLLAVAGVQVVAGLLLLLSPVFFDLDPEGPGGGSALLTTVVGLGFVFIGVVIGVLVANARLSGRFRAEEYRQRLAAAGVGTEERPPFLPAEGDDWAEWPSDGETGEGETGEGERGDDETGDEPAGRERESDDAATADGASDDGSSDAR